MDLRQRVIADRDAGPGTKAVAEKYSVSAAWVRLLKQHRRERGDIAIMDNLSAHKGQSIREAIEQAKASAVYLPPYSPDLAPHRTLRSRTPSARSSI